MGYFLVHYMNGDDDVFEGDTYSVEQGYFGSSMTAEFHTTDEDGEEVTLATATDVRSVAVLDEDEDDELDDVVDDDE